MLQYNILSKFTKKTEIINRQKRSNTMRNKMSQSGFTLIELIAVMVILGILAAVIIPRISTLTQGAYESNVRSMFGVIKNEVNAQAIKAAMSGGAGGHRERFPDPHVGTTLNYYLDKWVDEYDTDMWGSYQITGGVSNTNEADNSASDVDVVVFHYAPHGIAFTDVEDHYHIYYAAVTTTQGDANGYDYDGYIMWASKDSDLDGDGDVRLTITNDANTVSSITNNGDEIISDLTFLASP